jgi:hypothetical protein
MVDFTAYQDVPCSVMIPILDHSQGRPRQEELFKVKL